MGLALGYGLGLRNQLALGSKIPFEADAASIIGKNSREGSVLVDSINPLNNVNILHPYLNRTTNGTQVFCQDNGALDIGTNNLTVCGWVNDLSPTNSSVYGFFGKSIQTTTNGRYGFFTLNTSRYFSFYFATSTGLKGIVSTVVSNTAGWKFLYADINLATSKARFFIDNVQVGTDLTFTGTFLPLDPVYKFYLYGSQTSTGTSADRFTGQLSDIRVYHRLLTDQERARLYAKGSVDGAALYYPCNDQYFTDCSGNGLHANRGGWTDNAIPLLYNRYGSNACLENGYDVYKSPGLVDIHIPLLSNGVSIATTGLPATYYKSNTVAPDLYNHNMADSALELQLCDRSNTTIFSSYARAASSKYNASIPKAWHISELEILTIKLFTNAGYNGKVFPKFIGFRQKLSELITYNSNKVGNELASCLKYSGNYNAWHDIEYSFDSRNIIGTRFDTMLILDQGKFLQLSDDLGDTITRQIDITAYGIPQDGFSNVAKFTYIYENGDIIVCFNSVALYSHDRFVTVGVSSVLDINGNTFTPPARDTFLQIIPDSYFKFNGTLEIPVWGTISNYGGVVGTNIQCWYSPDNGVTIKSFYQFLGDGTPASVYHVHAINFCPYDESLWIQVGDGLFSNVNAGWYQAKYNISADTWQVDAKILGTSNDPWKTTGMTFNSGYVYWSDDGVSSGVWRVPYPDILDKTKYERVYFSNNNGKIVAQQLAAMLGEPNGNVITTYFNNNKIIAISTDFGQSWFTHEIVGGPDLLNSAFGMYTCIRPVNNDKENILHIVQAGESYTNSLTLGGVLRLKVTKP